MFFSVALVMVYLARAIFPLTIGEKTIDIVYWVEIGCIKLIFGAKDCESLSFKRRRHDFVRNFCHKSCQTDEREVDPA